MPEFKAPITDYQFILHDVFGVTDRYAAMLGHQDFNRELIDAIMEEGAKFCENELAPLFQSGDEEGCQIKGGQVITPKGFKEAYKKYIEGGWPALSAPEEYGGQSLPISLDTVVREMAGTANWAWAMYPGLSHGAVQTLETHGSEELKSLYLNKLISGEWTGTMCLTEAHCGTDLGLMRTKAEPNADGSYTITGTKIFISAGDHDLTDNVVHIVLARLPDAPEGTKGISLFVVPKMNVGSDGESADANGVTCGSLEHKMGIKASATCVMNFDNAKGFLIGQPNKGLSMMFTFMNFARIGTALQGVCAAERSFQGAIAYARERLAMRSLSGPKNESGPADPIIVHPDVRRMLLTQKSIAEGGRAMCLALSTYGDILQYSDDEAERQKAEDRLALLTPIAKAFLTELGLEAANHGVQVFGGHGYISEWGMEQIVRDTRISTLYEGTTGIQALDLLGRKVLMTQGDLLRKFTKEIHEFCKTNEDHPALKSNIQALMAANKEWLDVTTGIGMRAMQDRDEVGAASVDYLMYSGYVSLAYYLMQMAVVAHAKLEDGDSNTGFLTAKIQTAQFFMERVLPRAAGHKGCLEGSLGSLMDMSADDFYLA